MGSPDHVQDQFRLELDSLVSAAERRTSNKLLAILDNVSHRLHTVISNQRRGVGRWVEDIWPSGARRSLGLDPLASGPIWDLPYRHGPPVREDEERRGEEERKRGEERRGSEVRRGVERSGERTRTGR
ncbi:unnamed protein product [Gadus morhua 'NCC']